MKKIVCSLLAAAALVGSVTAAPAPGRAGPIGFVVGCCFGIRTAGAWNEGKELHFRDWGRIIPFVSIVLAVWDGFDSYSGVTTKDLQTKYPGNFF